MPTSLKWIRTGSIGHGRSGGGQADNTCFDLMINLDQISVDGAADMIARAAREQAREVKSVESQLNIGSSWLW